MNLDKLERKLIAAGRGAPINESVPYAFEKRVMAHIRSRPPADLWALWARALWRGAGACLAVVALIGGISLYSPAGNTLNAAGDLTQEFENTMLAAVDLDIDYPQ